MSVTPEGCNNEPPKPPFGAAQDIVPLRLRKKFEKMERFLVDSRERSDTIPWSLTQTLEKLMEKCEIEARFKQIHPDAYMIKATNVWDDKWRVNVYKRGVECFSPRVISNSYFCRSGDGELKCDPKIGD